MTRPKVLVGGPISEYHGYCTEDFLKALKALDYPNMEMLFIDNSDEEKFYGLVKDCGIPIIRKFYETKGVKKRMVQCRNFLRRKVLHEDFDYFFNVDQDVILPPDALTRLVSHKKPMVTGIYYNEFEFVGRMRVMPVLYRWLTETEVGWLKDHGPVLRKTRPDIITVLNKKNQDYRRLRKQYFPHEVEGEKLMQVKCCGTGCFLVRRDVLEKIPFRMNPDKVSFDDVIFCEDAELRDIPLYADTSVKCRHLVKRRPWTWEINLK